MQSVLGTARGIARFLRPGGKPHVYSQARPPLFQTFSPWWAKWAYGLLACDAFMTGSAMELTWKHWSEPIKDESSKGKQDAPLLPENYTLRPAWQRFGLCLGFFVGGVGAASALFIARFRFTRTLDVFPPLVKKAPVPIDRQVFIQSVHNMRSRGMVFPLDRCTLHKGRDDKELLLTIEGERGHWYMTLEKPLINGKEEKAYVARDTILKAWKGGWASDALTQPTPPSLDGRWKNRPVTP